MPFFVSYNGKAFDLPVLLKHRIVITPNQHCDLLEEIHRATRRRVKLDDLAKANLGLSKSGSGAAAPYEWQRGKFGSVVSYCLNDCFVLLKVYQKAREQGFLLNPYDGGRIPLSLNKQSASLFQ
jgi:DEAD/DEAH box helicase domain-containing protein